LKGVDKKAYHTPARKVKKNAGTKQRAEKSEGRKGILHRSGGEEGAGTRPIRSGNPGEESYLQPLRREVTSPKKGEDGELA